MIHTVPPRNHVSATLLLPTQLVFNIGFYAVVPFLALVMSEDLGLGAAAIGLVLGARTFSQQGLFLLGGMLADHWGPRRSILTGCIIRAAGYLGLATSDDFWPFLLSAVLTGIGGAFFSPAVEGLVGALDRDLTLRTTVKGSPRRNLFAWLVLFGEIGAVTGPLIGLGLLPFGFALVATSAALLFLAVGLALWLFLPGHHPLTTGANRPTNDASAPGTPTIDELETGGALACLRDRRFVGFAAFFSVNLLAYNQLYFALPLELGGAGAGTLAVMFALASILTIALQLPMAALAAELGPATALRVGFACIAAGFAAIAVLGGTGLHLAPGLPVMTGPIALVVLLSLGHMLAGPAGMQQVHGFAGRRPLGAYYGLLASCGGIAVLVGNSLTGVLRDTLGGVSGWVLLVLLATLAATSLPRFLPSSPVLPTALPIAPDQKVQS